MLAVAMFNVSGQGVAGIKGQPGDPGPDGAKGVRGNTGNKGIKGFKGSIGESQKLNQTQHKKASNHHANLPLEMYSFTL